MTFIRTRRPRLDGTFYPLTDVAKRLSLHPETLVDEAIHGKIKLFVRIPHGLTPYSVHQDAIDISDPLIQADKVARRFGAPDPLDSMPVNMRDYGLVGLLLCPIDCVKLRNERSLRHSLFCAGVRVTMIYGNYVNPIQRNMLFKNSRLGTEGWRIACYPSNIGPTFVAGIGYSKPTEFEIKLDDIEAITTSVELFLDDIDTNHFIRELIVGGHIVHIDDRPTYFSNRLNHVLDAHWFYLGAIDPAQLKKLVWNGKKLRSQSERKERDRVIESVRAQHDRALAFLATDDFRDHLQKNQSGKKLIQAAARFITPLCARGVLSEFTADLRNFDLNTSPNDPFPVDHEIQSPLIPPEVKALVAGAKLFWGHPSIDLADPNTHPNRPDVVNFMKDSGFRSIDAESAATIISHNAVRGRPAAPKTASNSTRSPQQAPLHKLMKK